VAAVAQVSTGKRNDIFKGSLRSKYGETLSMFDNDAYNAKRDESLRESESPMYPHELIWNLV